MVTVYPCFAESGTVSAVDEKAAPTVIFSESTGNAGTWIEGDGMENVPIAEGELDVRSYAERRNPDALLSVSDELMRAYRVLNSVSSLGELESQLDGEAQEIDESYSAAAFVVNDLFAVSLSEEKAALLRSGENRFLHLTVRCETVADGNRPVVIRQNSVDKTWSIAEADLNEDGSVSVRLSEPCVLAFLIADGERMQHREMAGTEKYIWVAVCATLMVVFGAVTLFVIFYRRDHMASSNVTDVSDTSDLHSDKT